MLRNMLVYTPLSYNQKPCIWFTKNPTLLRPLTTSQPNGLSILLQFGNQLITLLDHVVVLLVLVIWSVCLNDTLAGNSVDSAGDSLSCNEFG